MSFKVLLSRQTVCFISWCKICSSAGSPTRERAKAAVSLSDRRATLSLQWEVGRWDEATLIDNVSLRVIYQ